MFISCASAWGAVECPAAIANVGGGKTGSHLRITFTHGEFPDSVRVSGTTDRDGLKGNPRQPFWQSNSLYASLAQSLDLISGGVVVQTCAYDASGTLLPPVASYFLFYDPLYTPGTPSVFVSFSISSVPVGLNYFAVERSSSATGLFHTIQVLAYDGNSDYSMNDSNPILDGNGFVAPYNYYRIASYTSAGVLLGYSEVKVAISY